MCDSCPFLEIRPGKQGLLCCAAGVNFYAVGQARELCQLCPLSAGGWTPGCEFLEVYTFLHAEREQRQIKIELNCLLPEGNAPQPQCATCPAAGAPLPHGTPEAQPVQAVVTRRG